MMTIRVVTSSRDVTKTKDACQEENVDASKFDNLNQNRVVGDSVSESRDQGKDNTAMEFSSESRKGGEDNDLRDIVIGCLCHEPKTKENIDTSSKTKKNFDTSSLCALRSRGKRHSKIATSSKRMKNGDRRKLMKHPRTLVKNDGREKSCKNKKFVCSFYDFAFGGRMTVGKKRKEWSPPSGFYNPSRKKRLLSSKCHVRSTMSNIDYSNN